MRFPSEEYKWNKLPADCVNGTRVNTMIKNKLDETSNLVFFNFFIFNYFK